MVKPTTKREYNEMMYLEFKKNDTNNTSMGQYHCSCYKEYYRRCLDRVKKPLTIDEWLNSKLKA